MSNIFNSFVRANIFGYKIKCLKVNRKTFTLLSQLFKNGDSSNNSAENKNNNPTRTAKSFTDKKITLIQPNNVISVTSLEEAHKISKRRDMKLLKVQDMDNKSQRPVYK